MAQYHGILVQDEDFDGVHGVDEVALRSSYCCKGTLLESCCSGCGDDGQSQYSLAVSSCWFGVESKDDISLHYGSSS